MKTYWGDYVAFTEKARAVAPDEITDDWKVYMAAISRQTPVFEKYGYDGARAEQEATEDEQAVFEQSDDERAAFSNVLRYEAYACGVQQPPAADVDFLSPQTRRLLRRPRSSMVWDIAVDTWPHRACAVAGRNLSRVEWERYVGNRPYERTCD